MRQRLGGERLSDPEAAAQPGRAAHLDASAVRVADRFHDREAQARPSLVAGARAVDTEESFEDVREGFGGYADAVIRDVQNRVARLLRDLEFDAAAVGCVFDGVVEKVHDDLFEGAPYRLQS